MYVMEDKIIMNVFLIYCGILSTFECMSYFKYTVVWVIILLLIIHHLCLYLSLNALFISF
jgi:hypothetical protein